MVAIAVVVDAVFGIVARTPSSTLNTITLSWQTQLNVIQYLSMIPQDSMLYRLQVYHCACTVLYGTVLQ